MHNPRKNTSRVVIYGAGGHAKVVAEILRLNQHEVIGFIDNIDTNRKSQAFYGATVLGGEEILNDLLESRMIKMVFGFGNNRGRLFLAKKLGMMGFSFITTIHPNAICASDVSIGNGTVIASGAVVGPSTIVGEHAIVNTQASLDHDCVVSDGAHIGPGAVVTGSVNIGECSWIGAGAVIADHRHIGADAIVGAGAVVVKDVPEAIVVMGVPARFAREVRI
jgi:hypothetical protein